MSKTSCNRPPIKGWYCTRKANHEGPCALWQDLSAIGQIRKCLFGYTVPVPPNENGWDYYPIWSIKYQRWMGSNMGPAL